MNWKKMAEAFGKAVGKRTGEPNKTSKMIERVAGDSDDFLEGKRHGEFLKGKATDASYQAMYDRLDEDAKAVFDSYDLDYERAYGPNAAYRKALEDAKLDAYTEIPTDREGWIETYGFDISEPAPRNVDVSKRVDKLAAEESEKALNTEFDKAFDDVAEERGYKNWISNKDKIQANDGLGGEINNLEREGAVDDIRSQMIDDLKAGMPISDVLEKYGK